jgi:hypothetical protein
MRPTSIFPAVRVLSLWQPWASLMAIGVKSVETRSFDCRWRGWTFVHAARANTSLIRTATAQALDFLGGYGLPALPDPLPFGAIVAVGRVVDSWQSGGPFDPKFRALSDAERQFGDFRPGRWAWTFADLRPIEPPVPMRGSQGLFNLRPSDVRDGHWDRIREIAGEISSRSTADLGPPRSELSPTERRT